jgi:RNA polymerase sigma factor (sigma-70 family)
MPDPSSFAEFIARIRAGDARAAEELVRKYEPLVRRAVRIRLEDRRLERLFDSMDVCQSVLKSFFVRTAAGQYDLEEPGQLVGLLVAMAGNKLACEARRQHRQRRDQRRVAGGDAALGGVAAADPSPSRAAAAKDLLAAARGRLTDEERALADLRADGQTWDEVAARVGGTAQARRVQLARALDRVARELGIDERAEA